LCISESVNGSSSAGCAKTGETENNRGTAISALKKSNTTDVFVMCTKIAVSPSQKTEYPSAAGNLP
jgi:hypothetical protein